MKTERTLEVLADFIGMTIEKKEKTEGGIHIPGNAQSADSRDWRVTHKGPDVKVPVEVGDYIVVIPNVHGCQYPLNGKEIILIKAENIMAIVRQEDSTH